MSAVHSTKERKMTSDMPDRISNLPENVTQQILECLPLQEAARTSILSSHWKRRWAAISQLVLDENFFASILKKHKGITDIRLEYSKVVSDILLSHVGPIWKFVLFLSSWFPKEAGISHWVRYLRTNGVKEFTLENGRGLEKSLPATLFSCNNLTHLSIIRCNILPLPATYQGFPHLISLRWEPSSGLDTSQEISVLETLISKCPQLQSLCLYVYDWKGKLSICARKLQELLVKGWLIMNISLEETTCTKKLALDLSCDKFRQSRHSSDFLNTLLKVENLILKHSCWEDNEPRYPKTLPEEPERLQILKLVGIPLHCSFSTPLLKYLLLSSPCLRQLYIEIEEEEASTGEQLIQNDDTCILPFLQEVKLFGISGLPGVLQLIKFLLASSPALEEMYIEYSIGIGAKEEKNFDMGVLKCCRASPFAKVIVKSKN